MVTVITGASTGIGAEFATAVRRTGPRPRGGRAQCGQLEHLAAQLREAHGVDVTVMAMDLSLPTAAVELWQRTNRLGLEIDVLVNNAGFGTHCDVADTDPQRLEDAIELNCRTVVGATARYLPQMRARGAGTIINVASIAAFQPLPKMAVYGASKAFILSFTEALWAEERKHGVRVLAVCPGLTDTPFFEAGGRCSGHCRVRPSGLGVTRTPKQVVDDTLRALPGRKPSLVDGAANAFVARTLYRVLPRRLLIALSGRIIAG